MKKYTIEDVYDTLCGEVHGEYAVPGVENAYADGGECDRLYNEMSQAYERLRDRLGVVDEDTDVEIIINNLLRIQYILCEKMFRCGQSL
jgi:hypothetical protein